jgi:SSS family solute:Na+ symporter
MNYYGLNALDYTFIAAFFAVIIFVAVKFASRAGESLGEFFLSGRKLPWYIAGFSMVATTFAADTPLVVTELVNKNGIAGNWLWWNMLIGGMLTVFFFAKYWRRANITTDVEFVEIRYSGKPAAFLRGFKAIYLGVFMNSIIMGWINVALASILHVFFDIPVHQLIYYVAGAMIFTSIYSSISGLWGVAINDFIQFSIAMIGVIVLAVVVVNSPEIGGVAGLKAKLPAESLQFLPKISFGGDHSGILGRLSLSIGTFLAFVGVQWWASWYPGAEPGGGGYVAQRMMSAKDEKNSLWGFAPLYFTRLWALMIKSWAM